MKLLVTGGAGFIGSNFVHYINKVRPHWEVTVVDSLTYAGNKANLEGANYTFFMQDICPVTVDGFAQLETIVKSCDTIVHFAAETHVDNSINGPDLFIDTNVTGTCNLLELVRKHRKTFHHISTDEVYGALGQYDPPFTEESPYKPQSPYAASKASSDHLVRAWINTYGIYATITNCSNNYGPRQHKEKFIPQIIRGVLEGKKPKLYGEGMNIRDWLHVSDHCKAIFGILNHGSFGETYLIGGNCERHNIEIMTQILELMGKPGDWFEYVTDRPGHDFRYAVDCSKIKKEMDWEPEIDLETGLKDTIAWYENANKNTL